MKRTALAVTALILAPLAGCAKVEFGPGPAPDAMTYNEPVPYLQVDTARDCSKKTTAVSFPGKERSVKVTPGIGASNATMTLNNGVITNIGQQVDTKIPDTIGAVSGAALNVHAMAAPLNAQECAPQTRFYPIVNGAPDFAHPFTVP